MKLLLLITALCGVLVSGDFVEVYKENETSPLEEAELSQQAQILEQLSNQQLIDQQQPSFEEYTISSQEDPSTSIETLYIMDQNPKGSYRVTGMFQNVQTDDGEGQQMEQLLERPQISFFDLSWSNWIDERLQLLDLVQDLLLPSGSRCPHMQPESTAFDSGMVSYLASSRFGPAILTTYAQKMQEGEDFDFDYDEVNIPESSMAKTYADASLLDDLSSNANQAFQEAEAEARSLFQKDNLGFFAANLRADQDQRLYPSQLDGEFESVQPSLKVPENYFSTWGSKRSTWGAGEPGFTDDLFEPYFEQDGNDADNSQLTNCVIFVLLLIGCLYVWISLARSCCSTFLERKRDSKEAVYGSAQKELLAPLDPEKASDLPSVETAASQTTEGSYYQAHGNGFHRVLVPTSN